MTWFIAHCTQCDQDGARSMPIPFTSWEDREEWIRLHRDGTAEFGAPHGAFVLVEHEQ